MSKKDKPGPAPVVMTPELVTSSLPEEPGPKPRVTQDGASFVLAYESASHHAARCSLDVDALAPVRSESTEVNPPSWSIRCWF